MGLYCICFTMIGLLGTLAMQRFAELACVMKKTEVLCFPPP